MPAKPRHPAAAWPLVPWVCLALLLAGCASRPAPQPVAAPAAPPAPTASAPEAAPAARQTDAERRAAFDRSMARWHGAKVAELVARLGAPKTRLRLRSGEWIYTYARSTTVRGPAGPERFSCVVDYRVDARGEIIVGHRIQGC